LTEVGSDLIYLKKCIILMCYLLLYFSINTAIVTYALLLVQYFTFVKKFCRNINFDYCLIIILFVFVKENFASYINIRY